MREMLQSETTDNLLKAVEHLRERIIAGKVHSAFVAWFEEIDYCPDGCTEHISGAVRCRADLRNVLGVHIAIESIELMRSATNAPTAPTMSPAGHA